MVLLYRRVSHLASLAASLLAKPTNQPCSQDSSLHPL